MHSGLQWNVIQSDRVFSSQPDQPLNFIQYWWLKFWKVQDLSYKKISNHRCQMRERKTEMLEYSSYLQQPTVTGTMDLLTAPRQRILGEQSARTELQMVSYASLWCPLIEEKCSQLRCQAWSEHRLHTGCLSCSPFQSFSCLSHCIPITVFSIIIQLT